MPDNSQTEALFARIPKDLKYMLEDLARQQSRLQDKRVTVQDITIIALQQYIEREQSAGDQQAADSVLESRQGKRVTAQNVTEGALERFIARQEQDDQARANDE